MKVNYYGIDGAKKGQVDLNENVWGLVWNGDLVHQVTSSQSANQRAATAHTKDRGEVSGGGKKPWRQKGTGQARHGSSRSPIWRKGGVAHGPRKEKSYKQIIPKGMKNRALLTLLSAKLKDGKVLFVESFNLDAKTKSAEEMLNNISKVDGFKTLNHKKANNVAIFTAKKDRKTHLAFRNISNAKFENMDQMNPVDIANTRYVVVAGAEEVSNYLATKI